MSVCNNICDLYFRISKTVGGVVVDHAGGLHVGVDDCWADKFEASFF